MSAKRSQPPAAFRLRYADTRLGQMHLKVWPGPPDSAATALVCLHPVPYSGRYFDSFAAELCQRVSVVAVDLMGYGGSARLPEPVSIGDHAQAVADALQEQGIGRFVTLGFHTGSAIACELALLRPKKVPRVICITYPFMDAEERSRQLEGLGNASLAGEELESLRRRWRFTVNNRAAGVPLESALNNFIEELRAGDQAWFGFQSMFEYPSDTRLPQLKQPVLVINVEGSMKAATRAAAEILPTAHYLEFPQMSRGIFELHATRLAAVVADFIEGRESADSED